MSVFYKIIFCDITFIEQDVCNSNFSSWMPVHQLYHVFAVFALRILVSISAIGSLIVMCYILPYQLAFLTPGICPFICQFTEADTADSIFSQIRVRDVRRFCSGCTLLWRNFGLRCCLIFIDVLAMNFPPYFAKRHIEQSQ